MRTDLPESRTIARQLTAVRRATLTPHELTAWFGRTFGDIASYLYRKGIVPTGFPFARHHLRADGQIEVEAGFPVTELITGTETICPSSLPAGHVVVAWHVGAYDTVGTAYQEVDDWLEDIGGTAAGDAWEIYHDPPVGHPQHWRTEVAQPFTMARAHV